MKQTIKQSFSFTVSLTRRILPPAYSFGGSGILPVRCLPGKENKPDGNGGNLLKKESKSRLAYKENQEKKEKTINFAKRQGASH